MTYTDEGTIERYLMVDIAPDQSAWVDTMAQTVEDWIDSYTGKTFKTLIASDRYFDGQGGTEQDIDACVSVSAVYTVDGDGAVADTLTTDDYFTYPYQAFPGGSSSITKLFLKESNRIGTWPVGRKTVKVTAAWGAAAVPSRIKLAATILTSRIIEKGLQGGAIQANTIADVSHTFREIDEKAGIDGVYSLLDPFREVLI